MFHMKHVALLTTGVSAGPVSEAARRAVAPSPSLGATHRHAYRWGRPAARETSRLGERGVRVV